MARTATAPRFGAASALVAVALTFFAPISAPAQDASLSPSGALSHSLSWSAIEGPVGWSETLQSASGLELGLDGRQGPIRFQARLGLNLIDGILGAEMDRLWLRYTAGPLSLTAGRQAINWGRGLAWSPADLFASLMAGNPGATRSGSDALRLAVAMGETGSAEAVVAYGESLFESRYGARLSGTLSSADMGLAATWEPATAMASYAVDLRLDGALGLWAEASWRAPMASVTAGKLEALAGLDWSLGRLSIAAEYRFAQSWLEISEPPAAWPGRQLLFARASFPVNELVTLSMSAISDLEAGLHSVNASAGLDVAQGTRLDAWLSGGNGLPQNGQKAGVWSAGLLVRYSFL